ncbi:hypothetical protein J6TS7_02070 [Paenibacillus dendritiformis]|nr:hypothetical protein J6TS7_02070 [Paenibacillus dendritiformis]
MGVCTKGLTSTHSTPGLIQWEFAQKDWLVPNPFRPESMGVCTKGLTSTHSTPGLIQWEFAQKDWLALTPLRA